MVALRPATCEDFDTLWAVRTRAISHGCAAHYSQAALDTWLATPAPDSLRRLVDGDGGTVAHDGGRILGYAVLDAASGEVDAVFVEPEEQGRGIGAMLMGAVEDAARLAGQARLFLSASLNAVPFYQRAGFVAVREEMYAHRSGIALASVYMEKLLR